MVTGLLCAGLCLALVAVIYLVTTTPTRAARLVIAERESARAALRDATKAEVAGLVASLRSFHDDLAQLAQRERVAVEVRARVAERRATALTDLREPSPPHSHRHGAHEPPSEDERKTVEIRGSRVVAADDDDTTNAIADATPPDTAGTSLYRSPANGLLASR